MKHTVSSNQKLKRKVVPLPKTRYINDVEVDPKDKALQTIFQDLDELENGQRNNKKQRDYPITQSHSPKVVNRVRREQYKSPQNDDIQATLIHRTTQGDALNDASLEDKTFFDIAEDMTPEPTINKNKRGYESVNSQQHNQINQYKQKESETESSIIRDLISLDSSYPRVKQYQH